MDKEIGTVELGKLANFAIVDKNPLENLQVMYGVSAIKLMDENTVKRVGGIKQVLCFSIGLWNKKDP